MEAKERIGQLTELLKEANYRYYVETGRRLLGLPPAREEGWARMAF